MTDGAMEHCEVILGNSNKRFSGVTSTMLQTLHFQQQQMTIRVLGSHHLVDKHLSIRFLQALSLCRRPVSTGKYRVFHARRNDEMIQALLLRMLSKRRLKIVFTSTAQRRHTAFTRWLIRQMDCVVSTCHAAASYLERPPYAIVPHGVRTDIYFPGKKNTSRINIGIFGRVRPQKGIATFVEACLQVLPNHPNADATIIGAIHGQDHAFVKALEEKILAMHLEKRIRFLGEQPFDTIPERYRSMNVVAALSRNEGFGLTVLEAMSSGAAVIASEAGAWPEIVDESIHGYIVPIDDVHAVADKLSHLLSNPQTLSRMGQTGRDRILQKYRVETEANALCTIYRHLQHSP